MDKIQDEIIEEFSVFDDWLDKYDYLIGLSETLPPISPEHRTGQYLIEGCQSRVWVDARLEDGKVYYAADSDAIITKGIIALLIRVLNGSTRSSTSSTPSGFRPTSRPRGPTGWCRWSNRCGCTLWLFKPKPIKNEELKIKN